MIYGGTGKEIQGVPFYTIWNVAEYLRISTQDVDRYIQGGELQSQMIDKRVMISETHLAAFLETHRFPARWIGGDGV